MENHSLKRHGGPSVFLVLLTRVIVVVFFTSIAGAIAHAQNIEKYIPPPPNREVFSPASDLLAPWRSSRCALKGREMLGQVCVNYGGADYRNNSVLLLYNEDGTTWRRFDLTVGSPGYPLKAGVRDFVPFVTSGIGEVIILRIVGESRNWYKVEINENDRTTKFARRDDKTWSKTNWDGWLYYSVNLYLDETQDALRDSPNGKIIAASASIKFERVRFLKANGDWAYVEGMTDPHTSMIYRGWIRWKNDRDILVGCYFNDFKVPTR